MLKRLLEQNKVSGKISKHKFFNLKTFYKATVIKIVWRRHKDRQCYRIESPEINADIYGKLIFDKKIKTIP